MNIVEIIVSDFLSRFDIYRKNSFCFKGLLKSILYKPSRNYVMANIEPQNIESLNLPIIRGYSNCGIAFQGPIAKNNDFTIGSIVLFRKIYPDIKIVISTWLNELSTQEKKVLEENECLIIENESCPSENKGSGRKIGHLNNQLKSSVEGIRLLKNLGVQYVMKIRTDLRIYKYDVIPFLMNLIDSYPSEWDKINNRLINVSFTNNLIYCPFHMSDFIWFGNINDMENLYSIPPRSNEELEFIRGKSDDYLSKHSLKFQIMANKGYKRDLKSELTEELDVDYKFYYLFHEEAYIIHKFLSENIFFYERKCGCIADYFRFLKSSIIVVDESELNIYWAKYGYSILRPSTLFNDSILTKSIWLDIIKNYEYED